MPLKAHVTLRFYENQEDAKKVQALFVKEQDGFHEEKDRQQEFSHWKITHQEVLEVL